MYKINILIVIFILFCVYDGTTQDKDLIQGFTSPGNEDMPRAYWNWLNGDVTLSGITRDLEEATDKGLGG